MYREKIKEVLNAIKDSDMEQNSKQIRYKMVSDCVVSASEYVEAVIRHENQVTMASFIRENDPQEYVNTLTNLDNHRRILHNAAVSNMNIVNRIAKQVGKEDVFENIENMDRTQIAEKIISKLVVEYLAPDNEKEIDKNVEINEINMQFGDIDKIEKGIYEEIGQEQFQNSIGKDEQELT